MIYALEDDRDYEKLFEDVFAPLKIPLRFFFDEEDFEKNIDEGVHIMIIDHLLNGKGTGLDILKKIKARMPWVFYIAFTAYYEPGLCCEYLNNGCNRFVDKRKPKHLEELVKFVKEGLEITKKTFEVIQVARGQVDHWAELKKQLKDLEGDGDITTD